MSLRLAYMGTPDFAVPALKALLTTTHTLTAVYTQAPKPRGRGHQVQKSPVHELAEQHGLEVRTPKTLREAAAQAEFAALNPDLAIVAAYGLLLPAPILNAPRAGCINLHGSLLPRWRGAAPIQRAIEAGDPETGLCLMKMDEGLDTGPVYARCILPITPATTSLTLAQEMAQAGADLLLAHLDAIAAGTLPARPQEEAGMCYARKIDKTEARINWQDSAVIIERRLRAFTPWPALEFNLAGETVKLLAAERINRQGQPGTLLDGQFTVACGQDALRLLRVQRPGRGPVDGEACLRGLHLSPGSLLES